MPRPLWFRPSQVAETTRLMACCPHCLSSRHLDASKMVEAGYDLPLFETEKRLRCRDRGRAGTGPECGRPIRIQVWTPTVRQVSGIYEHLPVLKSGVEYGA